MPQVSAFGTGSDGRRVDRIVLRAGSLEVAVLTRGAILQDVRLDGIAHGLTLGAPDLAAYEGPMAWFGAVVGPVANRISGSAAEIGGKRFAFPANENGRTTLHGGAHGTSARHWTLERVGKDTAVLALHLADGDDGFPGNRSLRAAFQLVPPATLELRLSATTDAPTLMNLANHSYWNLSGAPDLSGHRLTIAADAYLPTDPAACPTGEVRGVAGTPFDFRSGAAVPGGAALDHNFCLAPVRRGIAFAAELLVPGLARMVIETTEPGLQVYDAAHLDTAPCAGHGGWPYRHHAGLALEAQNWPDASAHPGFPTAILLPEQRYEQITRWRFATA